MPSSYQPNIPTGLVNLDTDYLNLQNNFSQLDTTFGVDHYKFSDTTTNNGFHKQSTYPNQTTPTTASGQLALYSKNGTVGSALFMVRDGNAGTEVQLTSSSVGNVSNTPTSGYTWLPGGIFMQWGVVAAPGTTGTVTFPVSFDAAPVSIQLTVNRDTPSDAANSVNRTTAPTASQFVYNIAVSGAANLYWLAIGKKV